MTVVYTFCVVIHVFFLFVHWKTIMALAVACKKDENFQGSHQPWGGAASATQWGDRERERTASGGGAYPGSLICDFQAAWGNVQPDSQLVFALPPCCLFEALIDGKIKIKITFSLVRVAVEKTDPYKMAKKKLMITIDNKMTWQAPTESFVSWQKNITWMSKTKNTTCVALTWQGIYIRW